MADALPTLGRCAGHVMLYAFRASLSACPALNAGKVLMSIKTQGVTDPGQAVVEYRQSMQQIQQGLNEAILHEQVPPAYHEAIRKYFDSMEAGNGQAGSE